jgi:hypothetical protein
MRSLTLFIPGLLRLASDMPNEDIPPIPSMERLFGLASKKKINTRVFSDTLFQIFGYDTHETEGYPVAGITRLIDDDHSSDGLWMRADPGHLAADRGGVVLMDNSTFTINQHDSLVLAAEIKDIFSDRGFNLEAPTTNRWYLQLNEIPGISTRAIHEVVGNDIDQFMPTGDDKLIWHQLINEIQMCLHSSEVNEDRLKRGELPVNSVWLWGCGELPKSKHCKWTRVFSDEEISHGLAKHANVLWNELPGSINEMIEDKNDVDQILAVISFGLRHSQYHDYEGWQDFINYLEEFWFSGLLKYLKNDKLEKLDILTDDQKFVVTKQSLYKFWRRPKSIRNYIG